MSEPDSGWSATGSACAPERNSWEEEEEEDVVSGAKWELGGGMRAWEPALGLRLRCPEACAEWEGSPASGLVLWSARPGTGPSFLGTDRVDSGLWSSRYGGLLSVFPLEAKIKTNTIRTNHNNTFIFYLFLICFKSFYEMLLNLSC